MDTAKKYLFVINDAPYGKERAYSALRLAINLAKRRGVSVKVFLTADGVFCARKEQKTPDGYYNVERMIKSLVAHGEVAAVNSCCQTRGLEPDDLVEGVKMGDVGLQGDWTLEADQVLVF